MTQANSVHSTPRTDSPSKSLAPPLAKQEADREKSLRKLRRLRIRARNEISRLIAFLDASDPYVMTELEEEDDREEVGDTEPWLGSLDRRKDQTRWGAGCTDDAELDKSDDEQALGSIHCHSPEHRSQEQWAAGDRRDLDQDSAESGISDYDGLLEQIGTRDWRHGGMV